MNRSFKISILTIILGFNANNSVAQSAWDIAYIEIDSITQADVGRIVQLDFRKTIAKPETRHWRRYIERSDTGVVNINGVNVHFREVRKIYPDWGLLDEQYLESRDDVKPGTKLRIISSTLKEVNKDSIRINADVESRKKQKRNSIVVERQQYDIWIERQTLSGLMCKAITTNGG